MTLTDMYDQLLSAYGPQGWWPLLGVAGSNPTKTGAMRGYHIGDYSYPRTDAERFEICVGAILTQNTAWPNVESALRALAAHGVLSPHGILALTQPDLATLIRASGYFNVKARKLREFTEFYIGLAGATPSRATLLAVWGVGPETADSMLLYAYGQIEMIVDTYTRRILGHLKLTRASADYDAVKRFCTRRLPRDLIVYQEFHALLVEHAKRHYQRMPYQDPLLGAAHDRHHSTL
jgi:endonuclease-3 related protein